MQSLVPLISFFPASTMYVMAQFSVISCHMVSYFIIPCLSLSKLSFVSGKPTVRCDMVRAQIVLNHFEESLVVPENFLHFRCFRRSDHHNLLCGAVSAAHTESPRHAGLQYHANVDNAWYYTCSRHIGSELNWRPEIAIKSLLISPFVFSRCDFMYQFLSTKRV